MSVGTATTSTTRRWSTGALLVGVVAMNLSMVPATTVAVLVISGWVGDAWGGIPSAAGVVGTALGALSLSTVMRTRGRRAGLVLGYAVAVLGAIVAALAVIAGTMSLLVGASLLVAAMVMLGLGNASAQLSRYAAADMFPAERRGFGLSIVVWGGTVGALVGPSLIAPAATLAAGVGLPRDTGTFVFAVGTTVAATAVAATLPRARAVGEPGRLSWPVLRAALRTSTVVLAVTAMVTAQLVMVAVMTMTPLQLHTHGHGLDVVGWVLSAHMAGMFALSPVSGRLTDRWGARATIAGGAVVLVVANVVAFTAPTSHTVGLPVALFLLGYGWNLCFVGGSSLLSGDLPAPLRLQLQGGVEAVVWGSSAIGSVAAGPIFAAAGYAKLALLAALLAAVPFALLPTGRQHEAVPL